MPRLERLTELQRQSVLNFPRWHFDTTPWAPLAKPLSQASVAIVTSAGLHLQDDKPFVSDTQTGGDQSFRIIPSTTLPADLLQSHVSIGFNRAAMQRDINVTFPIDRLREMIEQGAIGSFAPNHYSFMGAIRNPTRIASETGPQVAQRLKSEGADLVLLTPT